MLIGIEAGGKSIASVQGPLQGTHVAEKKRAVVEERHLHAAGHRICKGVTIFHRFNFVEAHLSEHGLGGKKSLRDTYDPHTLPAASIRGEGELFHILFRIDANTFQGPLELFQALRQNLFLEDLRGL